MKSVKERSVNWYLKALISFRNFKGRARRKEYWYFFLFNVLIALVLYGIGYALGSNSLYYAFNIVALVPSAAVSVRRLHDIGLRGYWMFIVLIPIVGTLVLLYCFVKPSQPSQNKYGAVPE
jgi:uncharacterized membrane protein YhaH (DUF805 family)